MDSVNNIDPYADQFYYGAGWNRVSAQAIVGAGGSSLQSPSAITYFFYQYDNDGQSRGVGINAWNQKTTITLSNGTTRAVYTNYAGEPMFSALTDTWDDTASPALDSQTWNTFYAYDPQGRLLLTAEPSTQSQPDDAFPDLLDKQTDGTYQLMPNGQGLIEGTDYYAVGDSGTGAVPGYVEDTYVEEGQQAATKALQDYYQYTTIGDGIVSINPVSDDTVFSAATSDLGDSSGRDTHFGYDADGLQITKETETLPGAGGTIVTDYDSSGRVADVTDADGYTTTYSYDDPTGTVTRTLTVVNLATGATVTTASQPDYLGRPVRATDGDGIVTNIAYDDGLLQSSVTTTPVGGPTQTVVTNAGQGTITTIATAPDGAMQTVAETWLDDAGRTVQTTTYDGTGDAYTTEDMYDDFGRLYWTEDAAGTITQTDYDGLGRAAATWVGTTAGGLVETAASVYDNGGVGDGDVTESVDFPCGSSSSPDTLRVTQMCYDWQDRLVATKSGALVAAAGSLADGQAGFPVDGLSCPLVLDPSGEGADGDATQRPITFDVLDNLGEVTAEYVYDGNGVSVAGSGGVPSQPPAALLRGHDLVLQRPRPGVPERSPRRRSNQRGRGRRRGPGSHHHGLRPRRQCRQHHRPAG